MAEPSREREIVFELLEFLGIYRPGDALHHQFCHLLRKAGIPHVPSEYLVCRNGKYRPVRDMELEVYAVPGDREHQVGHRLEETGIPLFAPPERIFCTFSAGNIEDDSS
jgi:hypothetical protein